MRSFRSLVVLRRPVAELWPIVRDRLAELAASIPEVDSVRQLERSGDDTPLVRVVNEWRVRPQVSATLRAMLKVETLSWIDRNEWDSATYVCRWMIEPAFLREHVTCGGTTTFEPAMAGRGARVTFAGEVELRPGFLGALGSLEASVSDSVQSIVSTVLPRTLRTIVEAAAAYPAPPVIPAQAGT